MSAKAKGISGTILRVALGLAVVVLCGLVIYVAATKKPPPSKAAPIQARLELAAGEVTIDQGEGDIRASSGVALLEGAKVTTAKGARAMVRLPDGSTIFLRDESVVKLGADSTKLEKGEYWLDAPPNERKPVKHEVGEIAISAADSGLSIKRVEDAAVVYVARGMSILTAAKGRVEINAGEQATVEGGEPRVAPLAFWEDWTGGMADFKSAGVLGAGTGTIYGVDVGAPAGQKSRPLQIQRQGVRAVVREGLAETEVDQTFFNPSTRPVEGWYWFTVPAAASVTSFAVETNGTLVEGEFIEKREAAVKYTTAKSVGHAPAILEWVDNRTYRARIFPVPASGVRRVVVRYIELKPVVDEKLVYVYPLGAGDPVRIGEFSLSVDLGKGGEKMEIATLADARVENKGQLVTMRRSGFTPRADFQLEAKLPRQRKPLTISRFSTGGDSADYIMARYSPDVDWAKVKQLRGDVVVVVDTSAAGDEASRQLKTSTAEAILRAMSDEDRFALVSLDVRPTVLHPAEGLAAASDDEISKALERLSDHSSGGATDLASLFDVALKRLHGTDQGAVIYVGDGIATSGEMTGEQLVERLRRALSSSRARLFTVGVGSESDHSLLAELARAGGGQSFRVDENGEATSRALQLTAALKIPTITDFEIDLGAGLDEPFISASGKVSRGSEVVVLARTHHEIPKKVKVRGRIGGEDFEKEYDVKRDKSIVSAFVPRLWASEYVRRLLGAAAGPETERGRIAALGIEYGLMTPFTSVLALENEWAYSNMGIQRRRNKLRGVRLGALDRRTEDGIAAELAAGGLAPAMMFGCNSRDEAPAVESMVEPSAVDQAEANRQGGTGTRAKGDEGAMGTTVSPGSPHQRGIRGPAGAAKPQAVAPTPAPEPEAPAEILEEEKSVARSPARARMKKAELDDESPAADPNDALTGLGGLGKSGGKALAANKENSGLKNDLDRAKTSPDAKRAPQKKPADGFRRGGRQQKQGGEGFWSNVSLSTCSDAASRPLAQRVLLWRKRVKTASSPSDLIDRHRSALRACELPDWRAERTLLSLLQSRVKSEAGVNVVLGHFASRPDVQKFLARLILRRTVDERLVGAVERQLFGGAVDWLKADLTLSEIEDIDQRISKLKELMAKAPEDPNGDIRLVALLVKAGRKDEAVALGRRLRDRGFLTPHIARRLGDVLARAGFDKEAVRTYSEIVEFDPASPNSRRLLGDIYLGHGWYAPAYRQYKTITELAPTDALAVLRLASSAAGAGRIDEALRLERRVASAQGNPGPSDPRRWARLSSAARLARLLDKPPAPTPGQPKVDPAKRVENIKRELKALGLFSGPATLVLLTWEDLSSDLALVTRADDKDIAAGEVTDAAPAGIYASLVPATEYAALEFVARLRSVPKEADVALLRHDVTWDGKDFRVEVEQSKLGAQKTEAAL